MPASRTVVSVLLRELGDFSLHPQGRPAGGLRPPSAGNNQKVWRFLPEPNSAVMRTALGAARLAPRLVRSLNAKVTNSRIQITYVKCVVSNG